MPVDFSRTSRATLLHAVLLAKALQGKITLLHVMEPPNLGGTSELSGSILTDLAIAPEKLAQQLDTLARNTIPPSLFNHALLGQGAAGKAIVASAKKRRSSLIVVATHGYSGLKRVLLGSTAEYVVRHSPCPVLTIRQPALRKVGAGKAAAAPPITSILAPVDLSAPSRRASAYAAMLAARLGARLTLLHVVPPLTGSRRRPLEESRLNTRAAEGARARLDGLAQQLQKTTPRVTTRVATGEASEGILREAQKSSADLIVIATHARGGLGRILLGSTAENIVRHAPCPVLVVRRPQPVKLGWYNPLIFFPVAPMQP